MTSKKAIQSIWAQLASSRVRSTSGQYFVPPSVVASILTPDVVSTAVRELACEPEDRIHLPATIIAEGTTTFAILIWMQFEDSIVDFKRHDCLDRSLPLVDEAKAEQAAPGFWRTFVKETQWQFIPFTFRLHDDRIINPSVILPFIREVGQLKAGGFGTIDILEIYPQLQDFVPAEVHNNSIFSSVSRDPQRAETYSN